PRLPDEVMVDQAMAGKLGLRVGNSFRLRLFTNPEERDVASGKAEWLQDADPLRQGAGPLLRLRVVGINAWMDEVNTAGTLLAGPAFVKRYGRALGYLATPFLAVRLHAGDSQAAFATSVAKLYGPSIPAYAEPSAPFADPTVSAISLLAKT